MSRLAILFLVLAVQPAAAIDFGLGNLFKKKPKAEPPPSRVKQHVVALQTDPDEKKRLAAATELRGFDPRNNPDLVSALIAALQKDPSPAVRAEAATTLGKLKPVYQPAGLAMEAAQGSDPAAEVREALKSALWQYHLNGYRSAQANAAEQSAEPPLAKPRPTVVASTPTEPTFRPITGGMGKGSLYPQTSEPPLAKPAAPTTVLPTPMPANAVPAPTVIAPPVPTITPPPPTITPPPTSGS